MEKIKEIGMNWLSNEAWALYGKAIVHSESIKREKNSEYKKFLKKKEIESI